MNSRRVALAVFAAAFAIAELIEAPSDEQPLPGIIFGLVVLVGAAWAWKSNGIGAPILLGVLGTVELLAVVFVYRTADGAPAAWVLWTFGLLSLAVAVTAVMCLVSRRVVSKAPAETA